MHRIKDLRWHLLRYDDPDEPLALTDLETLEGKPKPTGALADGYGPCTLLLGAKCPVLSCCAGLKSELVLQGSLA